MAVLYTLSVGEIAMSGIPCRGKLSPRFRIFRCDDQNRPVESALLMADTLGEILAFRKRQDWNYLFEYHHRFYPYTEFKRLVEAGDIV
jgi:hypothetical protein